MKKNLLLFMLFSLLAGCVFAKPSDTPKAKNSYIVWTLNKAEKDTTANSISMDSVQIAYFNRFIGDSIRYYERDRLIQSELDFLRSEVSEVREKAAQGEYNSTKLWVRLLLFVLAGIVLGLAIYVFFLQRDLNDDSNGIENLKKEIEKRKKEIEDLKKEIGKSNGNASNKDIVSIESEIIKVKEENHKLNNRLKDLEHMLKETDLSYDRESAYTPNQQPTSKYVETQKLLYADSIIDGEFSHVKEQENDDTVFVLTLKSESIASVSIFRQAYGKVIANASYLEGCEKQIIGNSSVVIVREGEAEKGFNGKWKVVSPLKVEIR